MEGTGGAVRPSGPGVGVGIQFHPCVVLTLDDEGVRIAAPLADLLVALPPAVRAGIAVLDVRGDGREIHKEDTEKSVVSSSPPRTSASSAISAVNTSVPPDLDARLTAALARVTSAHQRDAVRAAGYRVSDARPLVLLVGHTTAPTLLDAAQAAQRATSRRFGHAFRLALLSDTRPTDPRAAAVMDAAVRDQPWDTILGWAGA
ncbi:MAG TPA: hypothetical protein VIC85_15580, partial [Ktedonobacterales bacterium]